MFYHDLALVDLGYWVWKEEGEIPEPQRIARMNRNWISDLMNYDALIAYERTQTKKMR